MKKLEAKNLPTEKELKKQLSEKDKERIALKIFVRSDAFPYVRRWLLQQAESDELRELLRKEGATDFEKMGQLVFLDNRAKERILKVVNKLDEYFKAVESFE